jgi:hypothetical protein
MIEMPETLSEIEVLQKLQNSLPYFAKETLKIRTKSGDVLPFVFNRAQVYLHQKIEEHRKRNGGKVRVLLVKGRQMGGSTYVQARFYHKLWGTKKSLKAFILTHEADATDNLFGMARTFWELQEQGIKPDLDTGNSKELKFTHNKCAYAVGTAGSKEAGRSATFQLFHGSEVSFWPNDANHVAASLTAVSDEPGTEIILESTANGLGNLFYRMVQQALRGKSDFEVIFLPWFWDSKYERECPKDWAESCPIEWHNYAYDNGLTWSQVYWAYKRNQVLAASVSEPDDKPCWKFKQEFPANISEAFQSSGSKSFIPAAHVTRARKPDTVILPVGLRIWGIDPARGGPDPVQKDGEQERSGDKIGIIDRCGRVLGREIAIRMDPSGNTMFAADQIAMLLRKHQPDVVNIDVGGVGAGICDRLEQLGFAINKVNFGSSPLGNGPTGDKLYLNRRAEMYDEMREWFQQEGGVWIPDDDSLQGDLCAAEWGPSATRYNSAQKLIIEEKDRIKARLGYSPDLSDAACFVENTLIRTPEGLRKISDIEVGDEVITPFGTSKVTVKWCSETDQLSTATFNNGSLLQGTPNHKIFTWGKSKTLSSLNDSDILEQYSEGKLRWWKLLSIMVPSLEFKHLVDIISHTIEKPGKKDYFIGACGLTISDLFQKTMLFIIRTIIGEITISQILNSLNVLNTQKSICESGFQGMSIETKWSNNLKICDLKLLNGTEVQRDLHGIKSMEKNRGIIKLNTNTPVLSVINNLNLLTKIRSSIVRPLAFKKSVSELISRMKENAKGVDKTLWRTVTEKQDIVATSVQTVTVKPTKVYNLTLEKHNVYYANDILVFNCLTFAIPLAFLTNVMNTNQPSNRIRKSNHSGY